MLSKLLTEFIGTFFLVLVIALTGNPIAIGVVLMVMVYMGGHVSGAHYNPAVSFGLWLKKKISLPTMINYWGVQLLGGIVAALVAWWLTHVGFVATPAETATVWQSLLVELLFTFALVLVIFNVAVSKKTEGNSFYGLAIGFTILAAAFAGGPISGGAFNPAVGLGPILFDLFQGGANPQWWIYLVGPLLGGALAAWVWGVQESQQ